MKKLIALLACIYLSTHLMGCTSKDSKEESDSPLTETASESVDGELEKVEGADQQAANTTTTDEGFLNEVPPEDALGEKPKDTAAAPTTEPSLDASAPPAGGDELSLDGGEGLPPAVAQTDTVAPPPDGFSAAPPVAELPPPAADPGMGVSSDTTSMAAAPVADDAPKATPSTYKKVEMVPFTREGILLNAVYVARPKDSYKSVAKLIYGDAKKQKELKKANPALSSLKTGDKVYYNSPQRPTDDQKVMTYYEDSGAIPETYVAKEGDDLKKVSKELLGFDNAWKEVYATNAVETKSKMTAGTELKYWKTAPKVDVVMNTPPPADPIMPAPPAEMPPEMPPPPPAMEPPPMPPQAAAPPPPPDIPPPPPQPPVAVEPPPPPPPVEPPPPPPQVEPKKAVAQGGIHSEEGMDNDTLFALAGGGIFLVGLSALVVIRKRKQQREMAAAFNDTQVGT